MNLGNFSTTVGDRLNADKMAILLWISTIAFVVSTVMLLLVSRLGLPLYFTYLAVVFLFVVGIGALGWIGRTMTGPHFFFAEQKGLPSVTGIGGGTDWASGAWILLLVAGTAEQKLIWGPALMLGLLMMSVLFAGTFFRSSVSTLPGFFAWRHPNSDVDTLVMIVTSVVLFMLTLAEFEVASRVLTTIGVTSPASVGWIVLALAIFPILMGGWLSLIFVNVVLVVWLLISVLVPALLLGLAPKVLSAETVSAVDTLILSPLGPLPELQLVTGGFWNSFSWVFALACGFSVMPHVFSRLVLGRSAGATMEHLGWSALFVFLILTSSALSIGAVIQSIDNPQTRLLASNHMLHILPYVAVFIAALNALSATLLALSSGIVRGVRRKRKLDPGERSMFGTRLTAIVLAIFIGWAFRTQDIPVGTVFILAITFAAGSLFIPMVAAVWLTRLPGYVPTTVVFVGLVVFALEIWHGLFGGPATVFSNPARAAFALIVLGGMFVAATKVANHMLKREIADSRAAFLRGI